VSDALPTDDLPGLPTGRHATPHEDPAVAGLTQLPVQPRRMFPGRRPPADLVLQQLPGSPADWAERLAQPVPAPRRIGVVALKGGVGKTTLAVLMAATLAAARRDPVVLFDTDTTFGSLALRTGVPLAASVHELAVAGDPGRFDVLAGALARSGDGVWVLPSGRDPEQSAALTEQVYIAAMNAVYRHVPVMVTDCGAGLATPLMRRVVSGCHSLVLATSPTVDGVLASHNVLRWLHDQGFAALATRSIVALSDVPLTGAPIDLAEARRRFAGVAGDVVVVPRDPHLATGGRISMAELSGDTRAAAAVLALSALQAAIAAG
jgi:MinD-like ATPase involved in chromosome partitioning or flagellar assembly